MEFASAQHPPVADHKSLWTWNSFSTLCLSWQIAMVVLFATCVTFAFPYAPSLADGSVQFGIRYAMFQDTHVMMALGFGFLYTLVRFWEGRRRRRGGGGFFSSFCSFSTISSHLTLFACFHTQPLISSPVWLDLNTGGAVGE